MAWCDRKGGPAATRYTVTAGKLLVFLQEEVINRPKRKKRKGESNTAIIGSSMVDGYVAAITDLWSQQANQKINSNPHPRNQHVKDLLRIVQRDTHSRRKANYEDRGVGSLIDGYTEEQFARH